MFVEVDRPVTVSATQTFGPFSSELWAIVNSGRGALTPRDVRTRRGGVELQPDPDNRGDQNPERIQIQFDGTLYPGPVPALPIDTRLDDVRGVVGYSFGNFEVNAIDEVVVVRDSPLQPDVTPLRATRTALTLASYNVLNLAPSDTAQLATLGGHIATNLRSPDIVALQEVQDDSGEVDDGVVSADRTLGALIAAVEAAGGPTYVGVDVDPQDNTQGGVPGGNIRTAYLYNPARVSLVEVQALDSSHLAAVGAVRSGSLLRDPDPAARSVRVRWTPAHRDQQPLQLAVRFVAGVRGDPAVRPGWRGRPRRRRRPPSTRSSTHCSPPIRRRTSRWSATSTRSSGPTSSPRTCPAWSRR